MNVGTNSAYAGIGATGDTGTGQFAAFGGGQLVGGSLTQTFASVAGRQYEISFLYGSYGASDATQSLAISAGDLSTAVNTSGSTTNLSNIFSPYSFTFKATSASTALTFRDVSGNSINVDGFLDNVSVSAVPEPGSTFVMLSTGLGALGLVLHRTRR